MNTRPLEPSVKEPAALLPLIMSFVALSIVLIHAIAYGVVHQADEGTPAHLFQLLIALQVPVIAFFAMKWLPHAPMKAARIMALQAGAVIVAFAGVFFLT